MTPADPLDVWLPTTPQILMASERAILATIQPESHPALDEVVQALKDNKGF